MKNQALFSSKDKSKKLKCRRLQFVFGDLRINYVMHLTVKFQVGRRGCDIDLANPDCTGLSRRDPVCDVRLHSPKCIIQ